MTPWPELVPLALGRLRILRVQFVLEAEGEARLPDFLGSTLRGALAMALRKMVCTHNLRPCDGCPVQHSCLYPYLFETPAATGAQAIRRMRDIPHPILIEPPLRHPRRYQPGDRFSFEIVLMGNAIAKLPYLVFAINEMAAEGLGVLRKPFRLCSAFDRNGYPVYNAESGRMLSEGEIVMISQLVECAPVLSEVVLLLETPLRLKTAGSLMSRQFDLPEFFKQACRRLWSLLTAHENIPADEVDFRPLLSETPLPQLLSSSLRWRDLSRYSNRQKTKLKIGGLIGEIRLAGNLETWQPLLLAISETHVGKSAVMGLGKIRLRIDSNEKEFMP